MRNLALLLYNPATVRGQTRTIPPQVPVKTLGTQHPRAVFTTHRTTKEGLLERIATQSSTRSQVLELHHHISNRQTQGSAVDRAAAMELALKNTNHQVRVNLRKRVKEDGCEHTLKSTARAVTT